jgi:threonine/homoserine/homoserine lactone efflux protein
MILALAGLAAGFIHVLSGPDHLAAIAPYAVDGKRGAWRTGVRWGLGHSAGVMVVGLLALMLRGVLHVEAVSAWGERCVGLVLIGLGIWSMRAALAARSRSHDEHHHDEPRVHGRAAFAVGTVHGLAGSSHVLGIVPALVLPSNAAASAYLALFGIGTVVAMGTFSSLAGWFAARHSARPVTQSALLAACSVLAFAVGGIWLFANSGPTHIVASLS